MKAEREGESAKRGEDEQARKSGSVKRAKRETLL